MYSKLTETYVSLKVVEKAVWLKGDYIHMYVSGFMSFPSVYEEFTDNGLFSQHIMLCTAFAWINIFFMIERWNYDIFIMIFLFLI